MHLRLDPAVHCMVWVSSDLRIWPIPEHCETCQARCLARDVAQVDDDDLARTYRRLDPRWLAWLHQRMQRAQQAAKAGDLPADAWERLRTTYNALWVWVKARYPDWLRDLANQSLHGYTPPLAARELLRRPA